MKKYLPIISKEINTEKSVNLFNSYKQVIEEVKNKEKILTYEAVWLYAFSNIEREKFFLQTIYLLLKMTQIKQIYF